MTDYDFTKIPLDKIVHLGQRTLIHQDIFSVSWLLGRYCNYACPYCWPYARSDEKDHRPTELCISTMDEIKRQSRERGFNSFHFSFSGGEPTLHPGYLDILRHYASDQNTNFQSVHMTTNLSPGERWFEKYVDATKTLHRVSITASWHRTPMRIKNFNLQKHMKEFRNKIIFLQSNDIHVTINMVMVPEMWDELYHEAEFFNSAGINVTLKPQSDPTASRVVDGYTPEMLGALHNGMVQQDYTKIRLTELGRISERPKPKWDKLPDLPDEIPSNSNMQIEMTDEDGNLWFMDQAERFNAFNFNKFTGWACESGYRSIIIREPDGSIKRAYSCFDKPLGNIETGFKLFDAPKVCNTPSCVSSADSKIPKSKI